MKSLGINPFDSVQEYRDFVRNRGLSAYDPSPLEARAPQQFPMATFQGRGRAVARVTAPSAQRLGGRTQAVCQLRR